MVNCPNVFTPQNVTVHLKMNSYYWSSVCIYPVTHTQPTKINNTAPLEEAVQITRRKSHAHTNAQVHLLLSYSDCVTNYANYTVTQ